MSLENYNTKVEQMFGKISEEIKEKFQLRLNTDSPMSFVESAVDSDLFLTLDNYERVNINGKIFFEPVKGEGEMKLLVGLKERTFSDMEEIDVSVETMKFLPSVEKYIRSEIRDYLNSVNLTMTRKEDFQIRSVELNKNSILVKCGGVDNNSESLLLNFFIKEEDGEELKIYDHKNYSHLDFDEMLKKRSADLKSFTSKDYQVNKIVAEVLAQNIR